MGFTGKKTLKFKQDFVADFDQMEAEILKQSKEAEPERITDVEILPQTVRVSNINREPWFIAKDVAVLLGYKQPADTVRMHCRKAISAQGLQIIDFHPATKLIPESDLYRLIMRSNLEEAERFQAWVVEEVLPTIRKNRWNLCSLSISTCCAHVLLALHSPYKVIADGLVA